MSSADCTTVCSLVSADKNINKKGTFSFGWFISGQFRRDAAERLNQRDVNM
jgi:hypothetical protein